MTFADKVGYVAASLVLLTFCQKRMTPLRLATLGRVDVRSRRNRLSPRQGWLAAGMLRGVQHGGTDGGTVAGSVG